MQSITYRTTELGLAGDFSTNAKGDVDTNLTRDEFDIEASSGGGGNDWFNTNYDSKSKSVSDTNVNGWTYHSESESTGHEDSSVVSDSDSSFTFGLSKPTGGDVSLTFDGGSSDGWHVNNESNGKSESRTVGSSPNQVYKSEWKSKYKVDDFYDSSYNGNPSARGGPGCFATLGLKEASDRFTNTASG